MTGKWRKWWNVSKDRISKTRQISCVDGKLEDFDKFERLGGNGQNISEMHNAHVWMTMHRVVQGVIRNRQW